MRTRDGILLRNVRNAAEEYGISVREGTRHPYVLNYGGLRPCPVGESTNVRTMLVPWFRLATGLDNNTIYRSLRSGHCGG